MKIVHLTGYFSKTVAYQENLITKGQSEFGHKVYVIASRLLIEIPSTKSKREQKPGVSRYHNVILIRSKFAKEVKKNSLIYFGGVLRKLIRVKPDYIFLHDKGFYVFSALLYKLFFDRKVLLRWDCHSDFTNSMNSSFGKFYHGVFRWTFMLFGYLINRYYYIAPEMGHFVNTVYKLPKDKCELLRLPGDASGVEKFSKKELRKKWNLANDHIYVFHSGKMPEGKRTLELLEAIEGTEIHALLAGSISGPQSDVLKKRIDESANATHMGWLTPQELRELIKAVDILVQPGTLSNTFVEATCIGTPMILEDTPQGRDLIANDNGILIPAPVTPEAIRSAMEEMVLNHDYYIKNSSRAKEKFDYKTISKQTLEV